MFRYMLYDLKQYLNVKYGIVLEDEVVSHLLWADDLVLLSETPEGLQEHLAGLQNFCGLFQMIVNEKKTKIMHFGNSVDFSFSLNNKVLETVDEYKYLGVIFNPTKTLRGDIFKRTWSYFSEKGNKASFAFLKKFNSLGKLTPDIALKLFDTNTTSILDYASEIWSKTKPIDCVERVQLSFLKLMLGVKGSTCNISVLGETGRYPLYLNHIVKTVKYWIRLVNCKQEDRLVKKAFNVQRTLLAAGYNVWLSKVFNILHDYDLLQYWDNDCNLDDLNNILKQKVYECYDVKWSQELEKYPILTLYKQFKTCHGIEKYLQCIRDSKLRRNISKLRLSSHHLHIETGRHCRPKLPREERLCLICNKGNIEDEIHFLFLCPKYTEERVYFFNNILQEDDSILIDDNLLQSYAPEGPRSGPEGACLD